MWYIIYSYSIYYSPQFYESSYIHIPKKTQPHTDSTNWLDYSTSYIGNRFI